MLRFFLNAAAVFVADFLLPGMELHSFFSLLWIAFVLSLCNTFLLPFLRFITWPLRLLTLGLFSYLLNALLLYALALFFPQHLHFRSFWDALLAAFAMALTGWFLTMFTGKR